MKRISGCFRFKHEPRKKITDRLNFFKNAWSELRNGRKTFRFAPVSCWQTTERFDRRFSFQTEPPSSFQAGSVFFACDFCIPSDDWRLLR